MLGRWLVGVRPDSDRTRRRLIALLGPYLAPGESEARTNFSLRAPGRFPSRQKGSLYIAGGLVLESRRWESLLHALVGYLAGIAADAGDDAESAAGARATSGPGADDGVENAHRPLVQGRVVALDGRAVIVTASCTGPLDVAEIAALGGAEVPVWQPVIDPASRTVLMPDPLDGLDWSAAGIDPPAAASVPPTVVGVVTGPSFEGRPDLVSAWMTGRRALDEWGVLLSFLDAEGRIRAAATPAEVIARAAELLRP